MWEACKVEKDSLRYVHNLRTMVLQFSTEPMTAGHDMATTERRYPSIEICSCKVALIKSLPERIGTKPPVHVRGKRLREGCKNPLLDMCPNHLSNLVCDKFHSAMNAPPNIDSNNQETKVCSSHEQMPWNVQRNQE